jgi:UDP-3-O-[3-hydroxymyristoyl] glucosamine N-acyltransferase
VDDPPLIHWNFVAPMKARVVSITAHDLATRLKASLHGNGDLAVTGLCPVLSPEVGHLTFIKGKSPTAVWRMLIKLPEVAVLVEPGVLPDAEMLRSLRCVILAVASPHSAFVDAVNFFYDPEPVSVGVDTTARIDPTAIIGEGVSIGAFCVIGPRARIASGAVLHNSVTLCRDVAIGSRTHLHSGVVVREGCTVGNDCTIHNNSVIGADGFGYIPDPTMGIRKVPQVGVVIIGDHVEIGANTSIDRATVGTTSIGSHTKIDNQVQIAHNATIGRHCLICAQVGIAGSATIGDGVILGGGTGVADHVQVAPRVRVGGHSGVTSDILEPGDYLGMPAIKAGLYRRQQVSLKKISRTKPGGS